MFQSVFEGFESFLFVPNTTSRSGVHIHDSIDSKRTMTVVIVALLPALLFGMYNVGYQHYLAIGELAQTSFWSVFLFGFLAVLPKIVVSYVVGLGIEFTAAQLRHHEIQEGFLVSGMLIPMIVPVDTPLWMIAVATALPSSSPKRYSAVRYDIFNIALVTRAFLFFAYPSKMSGDEVFVRTGDTFGLGCRTGCRGLLGSYPLGSCYHTGGGALQLTDILGNTLSLHDMFLGFIPGSNRRDFDAGHPHRCRHSTGYGHCQLARDAFGIRRRYRDEPHLQLVRQPRHLSGCTTLAPRADLPGRFCLAAVFMATDPVTGARTNTVNTSSVSWWVCWPSSSGYSTADTPKAPCWPCCL